jgi:cell wall-associated NlpC family hydrolase
MARRGTLAWADGGRRDDDPIEHQPLIPDAVAAARGLDPPRGRRSFRSRLAASLVFATIFCAGAALTAGAGNEVANQMDATPLAESAPAEAPAAETTPAGEERAAEAAPAEAPAPAPEAATDPPAAEPEPAPAVDAGAPAPAAEAPAAQAPAAEPDPSDAAPAKPASADVVESFAVSTPTHRTHRTVAKRTAVEPTVRRTAPRPRSVPVAAPIPFQALAFDPQEWLTDNPATSSGGAALAIAEHYLGVPYRWGGSLPASGFDCSGLTMFVYDQLGVRLPHYAASQFAMFPKLDPSEVRPGDLVFFEPKFDGPGHVAVYAGGDRILEAPHTGALVRYASFSRAAAALGFLGAVRPYSAVAEQQLLFGNVMYHSLFIHAE